MSSASLSKPILLIDDEPDIREMLRLVLEDAGYAVETAANGDEGLRLFQESRTPVVLTDIRMPGMDGIALLREIKALEPDTEVIMVTGHGDLDTAIQSLRHEAADFITKPIHPPSLEMALDRAWDRIEMRARLQEYHDEMDRMVQEELRAARHKYHLLFESSPCYITVQDRSMRILESNDLFRRHFGDRTGEFCHRVYRHRKESCKNCPVLRTFADGESHQQEILIQDQNGKTINALVSTAAIRDADGRVSQVMELITDITEIRELQDHLTSLGMLIGSVSHGVKGLLTGLDSGMYKLTAGMNKGDEEKMKDGLEIVRLMTGRIRKQVLDLLHYAKNRDMDRRPVRLEQFVEGLVVAASSKAESANIQFSHQLADGDRTIEIDEDVLSAALVNILENAVDACASVPKSDSDSDPPANGGMAEGMVELSTRMDGDTVVFVIRDNGIGMDDETREKMFTLFFSSKGNKGTGLGLFISHRMIRQHGGDIEVESVPGQGACFTVRIPAAAPVTESGAGSENESRDAASP